MRNGEDASEPVLPLSSSGVIKATAAASESADEDAPPPLPPPGVPSLNNTLTSEASTIQHSKSKDLSHSAHKSKKKNKHERSFEEAVKARGVQKKDIKSPTNSDDPKEFDLEIASHTSGLSRPSSRASKASEMSGLGEDDDFLAKYKMMKLLLKEKEKELQKAQEQVKEAQEFRPTSPKGVFPQMFGRARSENKLEEEEVLLEPPDPALILAQVRRRRLGVLFLIFVGMCTLPVLLVQSFRNEITP
eukprot:gnl/MRDRNA2_/MRDRNA2_32473_c0_seq1.p1 gnl/MRDRNA2_/MRDRNA2_32473_c0~~gnl/MRDRNA2_/MRDRNA2_32473_c0_seq1.p1  ORF type:complete len:246 (-),score=70.04 gnl/MRDRNA2_/MRDRNA2_32473_c0_seq1:14-751(-)